jgi:hypothetical protein
MTTKPDCRTCGVCCVACGDQDVYCDVDEKDLERLSPGFVRKHIINAFDPMLYMAEVVIAGKSLSTIAGDARELAIRTAWKPMKTGPFAGYELNVCAALRGSVLSRVSCSVYRNRPAVCRTAVKPGQRECLIARDNFERAARRVREEDAKD